MGDSVVLSPEEKSLMNTDYFTELLRTFSTLVSRRGVLAAATSGLFAVPPAAREVAEAEAKTRGKRRTKRKRKRRNQASPPPPSSPGTRADVNCSGSNIVPLNAGG